MKSLEILVCLIVPNVCDRALDQDVLFLREYGYNASVYAFELIGVEVENPNAGQVGNLLEQIVDVDCRSLPVLLCLKCVRSQLLSQTFRVFHTMLDEMNMLLQVRITAARRHDSGSSVLKQVRIIVEVLNAFLDGDLLTLG
jgi:hypothetical protein